MIIINKKIKIKYFYSQAIDSYFERFNNIELQNYISDNNIKKSYEYTNLIIDIYFNSIGKKYNNDINAILLSLMQNDSKIIEIPDKLRLNTYKNNQLRYIEKPIEIQIVYTEKAPSPPLGQFTSYLDEHDQLTIVCIIGNVKEYNVTNEWICRGIDYSILKYLINKFLIIDDNSLMNKLIWFSYYFIFERKPKELVFNNFGKQMDEFERNYKDELKNRKSLKEKLYYIYKKIESAD
ncbi:hypothetical protein [Staphylococcus ratti]|uniref:Uncharacterized protein n=1 Tax=Staphylococcus ratti TaxID=2892440 RepID=A0ABY3PB50_9STAP|nr:hypothetical protein [Staphylococcus ratti]UEX89532.1 hypothetical protein LN051_08110 [Staphylococcus ratti]